MMFNAAGISPELAARLIAVRRDLHQHPELSFAEERTRDLLERELQRLSPTRLDRVAKTGLIARIAGTDRNAPVVAVRGDIDALPIHEATGLSFASQTDGAMHACGHDVHAAWTLGAATLLSERPAEGDVLIVLQPAEEIGEGARAVLQSGLLDDTRAIFGAHVDRRFVVGQVVAQPGPLAASADVFEIVLTGKGAHGARPHESADPVVCMASMISALQTIVARRVNPATPAVVTVGMIHAGSAPNVIPEHVEMRGTLRATDYATRTLLQEELTHICTHIAAAHRVNARVTFSGGVPPVVNDVQVATWAASAAADVLGADAVVPLGYTNMAGEDFACYQERIPGCFLRVGARGADEEVIAAHSPRFDVAEGAIGVGAAVLAECARRASSSLKAGAR